MIENKQRLILRRFIVNRKTMRDFNLSSTDISIMITIFDNEDCRKVSQKRIADEISMAQSSTSKRLSSLIKRGILSKGKSFITAMGYSIPISFYKPTESFMNAANYWYENKDKKESFNNVEKGANLLKRDVAKEKKKPVERQISPENEEKLKAMSNLKSNLWG